jgi:hypothetical protein
LNANPTGAHDIAVEDVATIFLLKIDAQRRCQRVHAGLAPKRSPGENTRHLRPERARRQATGHDVEALTFFAGAVSDQTVQADVSQDTCHNETPRARRVHRFVHGEATGNRIEHTPGQ